MRGITSSRVLLWHDVDKGNLPKLLKDENLSGGSEEEEEEEDIVFCFGEGGAVIVLKDHTEKKPPRSCHGVDHPSPNQTSPSPLSHERKGNRGENYGKLESETMSADSSFSSQSDGSSSSSSFAFPVLSRERVGSPEQMPKPDVLHLRKHRPCWAAHLPCCRF